MTRHRRYRDARGRWWPPQLCRYCGDLYRSPGGLARHEEEHEHPELQGPGFEKRHPARGTREEPFR